MSFVAQRKHVFICDTKHPFDNIDEINTMYKNMKQTTQFAINYPNGSISDSFDVSVIQQYMDDTQKQIELFRDFKTYQDSNKLVVHRRYDANGKYHGLHVEEYPSNMRVLTYWYHGNLLERSTYLNDTEKVEHGVLCINIDSMTCYNGHYYCEYDQDGKQHGNAFFNTADGNIITIKWNHGVKEKISILDVPLHTIGIADRIPNYHIPDSERVFNQWHTSGVHFLDVKRSYRWYKVKFEYVDGNLVKKSKFLYDLDYCNPNNIYELEDLTADTKTIPVSCEYFQCVYTCEYNRGGRKIGCENAKTFDGSEIFEVEWDQGVIKAVFVHF